MRRVVMSFVLLGSIAFANVSAQSAEGFNEESTIYGVTLGFGGLDPGKRSIGIRIEKALGAMTLLGPGILGAGVGADYYGVTWDAGFGYTAKQTYIPFGGWLAYHFRRSSTPWDPFIALGLNYVMVEGDLIADDGTNLCTEFSFGCSSKNRVEGIARVGIRYIGKSGWGFQVDAGAGAARVNFGVVIN